jgi:hypothetical protein
MRSGIICLIQALAMLTSIAQAQTTRLPKLPIIKNPPKTLCELDPTLPSCPLDLPALPGTGAPGTVKDLCDWMPDHSSCMKWHYFTGHSSRYAFLELDRRLVANG